MASRNSTRLGLVCLIGLLGGLDVRAQESDERALRALWELHRGALTNSSAQAAVAAACSRFETNHPASPWLPVSRGLAAWHALQAGDLGAAAGPLNALAAAHGSDPLSQAGVAMAQRWLTRLDRERVRSALQAYYRVHVRFPDALAALAPPADGAPLPLKDRFDKPWVYELGRFQRVRGLVGQRYTLASATLGTTSDLALALARTYGAAALEPVEVTAAGEGKSAVRFKTVGPAPKDVVLTDVNVAYLQAAVARIVAGIDGDGKLRPERRQPGGRPPRGCARGGIRRPATPPRFWVADTWPGTRSRGAANLGGGRLPARGDLCRASPPR